VLLVEIPVDRRVFQAPEIKTKMNNRDLFFNFVTRSPTIETFMFSEQ